MYSNNFETSNEVIIEWITEKLGEVCRCIGIFTKYLVIPRNGYMKISHPVLNLPIVVYIVEDLFNCARISKEKTREVYPEDFAIKVRSLIRKEFQNDIVIGPEVVEYLWKYISFGVANLTEGLSFKKDLEYFKKNRQKTQVRLTQENIRKVKQRMDAGDKKSRREFVMKTIDSYYKFKHIILKAKDSGIQHGKEFQKQDQYIKDGMFLIFSDEDSEALIEFGVYAPRLIKLKSIVDVFATKIRSIKKNRMSYEDYKRECLYLLTTQDGILRRIIKDLENSAIGRNLRSRNDETDKNYRTGERALLDRVYASEKESMDKWKRPSITKIFIEDADYEIRKRPPVKPDYEATEKWLGEEDIDQEYTKLTQEMREKNYIDFKVEKDLNFIVKSIYDQLNESYKMINNDEDLVKQVSNRITNKIKERIKTYQTFVSMRECDQNFDLDIDNCILQSLVYLSVSVSDWLEISTIGSDEIKTVLKILLPEGLQDKIELKPSVQRDEKFSSIFIKKLKSYGINISTVDPSIDMIISIMTRIKALDVDDKNFVAFNNRAKYFANSLVSK